MNQRPMLQNDPLLSVMDHLRLGALALAIVSFVALPCCLFIWCSRNKTLRLPPSMGNPEGHGLLSAINLYLLLIAPVNFFIFSYYEVYSSEINALFSQGVLLGRPVEAFSILSSWYAKAVTAFGYLAAIVLATLAIVWASKDRRRTTNWLYVQGRPRPIAYYFLLMFFVVQLAIVFNWLFRHVLIWIRLNKLLENAHTNAFDPDRMFGLGPISRLTLASFLAMSAISLLIAVWLLGARVTLRKEGLYRNPGHLAAAVTLLILGPTAVLLPLAAAHRKMEDTQRAELNALAIDIARASTLLRGNVANPGPNTHGLIESVEAGHKLYDFIDSCATWPISPATLGSLPFGFLVPLLVPIAVDSGKRLIQKFFPS